MKIAVEGCAHGELEKIYECLEKLQEQENILIDLLICCGDFQSVRNKNDLKSMAVPEKYQNICTFYKYYSGEKTAPVPTIFIGGNHEASNYLQELPYGGWVAPNIYYLGRAGVVRFGDLRIGGLSGIFKGRDYYQGLWECPPYNPNSMRSVYHIRAIDVFRLRQLKDEVHVMLSHDWPRGITAFGDVQHLLRRKPFFREDIESNQLGSMPAEDLLKTIKPKYWFAAHLHCQFAAIVPHEEEKETKFLALDKCLPHRRHLQILDVSDVDGDKTLKYDAEWLAILRLTNHLLTVRNVDCHLPGPGGSERFNFTPTIEEKNAIVLMMGEDMRIKPESFIRTAPPYTLNSPRGVPPQPISNPQTTELCELLGIDDPLQVVLARSGRTMEKPNPGTTLEKPNPGTTLLSGGSKEDEKEEHTVEFASPKNISRLSLPVPISPSVINDEFESRAEISLGDISSFIIDTSMDTSDTTPNKNDKKMFKRRNQSLYNMQSEDEKETTEVANPDESPKPTKLPFKRRNRDSYTSDLS